MTSAHSLVPLFPYVCSGRSWRHLSLTARETGSCTLRQNAAATASKYHEDAEERLDLVQYDLRRRPASVPSPSGREWSCVDRSVLPSTTACGRAVLNAVERRQNVSRRSVKVWWIAVAPQCGSIWQRRRTTTRRGSPPPVHGTGFLGQHFSGVNSTKNVLLVISGSTQLWNRVDVHCAVEKFRFLCQREAVAALSV